MLTTWLHGTEQTTVFSNSSDGTVNIVTFQLSHRASSRRIVNSSWVERGCRCFAATAASFSHLLTPCLRMLILLALHLLPLLFQTITSTTTGPLPFRLKATQTYYYRYHPLLQLYCTTLLRTMLPTYFQSLCLPPPLHFLLTLLTRLTSTLRRTLSLPSVIVMTVIQLCSCKHRPRCPLRTFSSKILSPLPPSRQLCPLSPSPPSPRPPALLLITHLADSITATPPSLRQPTGQLDTIDTRRLITISIRQLPIHRTLHTPQTKRFPYRHIIPSCCNSAYNTP